jgi:hypothetical protein
MVRLSKEEKIFQNILQKLLDRFAFKGLVDFELKPYHIRQYTKEGPKAVRDKVYWDVQYIIDLKKLIEETPSNYPDVIYDIENRIEKVRKQLGIPEEALTMSHDIVENIFLDESSELKKEIDEMLVKNFGLSEDEVDELEMWVSPWISEEETFSMRLELGSSGGISNKLSREDLRKLEGMIYEKVADYPYLNYLIDSDDIGFWWEY